MSNFSASNRPRECGRQDLNLVSFLCFETDRKSGVRGFFQLVSGSRAVRGRPSAPTQVWETPGKFGLAEIIQALHTSCLERPN